MTERSTLFASLHTFLRERVQPNLDPYLAYENRIAINLLGLLEREALYGGELAAMDSALASRLSLNADSVLTELAIGLRDASVTVDPDLVDELRRRTLLQLAIDNPRYSGRRQALDRWPDLAEPLSEQPK